MQSLFCVFFGGLSVAGLMRVFLSVPQIVNPHLLKDLTERGLWSDEMKNQLIAQNGSIQVNGRPS